MQKCAVHVPVSVNLICPYNNSVQSTTSTQYSSGFLLINNCKVTKSIDSHDALYVYLYNCNCICNYTIATDFVI